MNYAVWRRSKLKIKTWHAGHNRHIALLKRTQKQVKIGCSVYIYKTTRIHMRFFYGQNIEHGYIDVLFNYIIVMRIMQVLK